MSYKEWKNYGHNKSYLLDQAFTYNKSSNAKYLIWHDADEVFLTDINNQMSYLTKSDADELYDFLESNNKSITYIKTFNGNTEYDRWNIVRNNQLYIWKSPKHEWLDATVDNSSIYYDKMVLLASLDGSARKDINRNINDSKLFLDYIDENGGPEKCPREIFYLAQEMESFDVDKSIDYYLVRTQLDNGYYQEKYISYLRSGRLCKNVDDKIKYFTCGYELIPSRLECIYELMLLYYNKNDLQKSLKWGLITDNRTINHSDLFIESLIYRQDFDKQLSLTAYYIEDYLLADHVNRKNILKNKNCDIVNLLISNQKFIDQKLGRSFDSIETMLMLGHNNMGLVVPDRNNIVPTIIVIDDFYENALDIRNVALSQEFSIKGNYPGGRTKSFATNELKAKFENIIGKKITYWPDGYNGSFQYTTKENVSWIHRDLTNYSAVIYLTPNASPDSGIILYRHKKSGLQSSVTPDNETLLNIDSYNDDAWDKIDIIGNKFNRCILFNGKMSHKSNVYFGDDKFNGRLFQTFFFNIYS